VPRKLGELTGCQPPKYRAIYGKVLDGAIPTVLVNGRHYVPDAELSSVAALFGIVMPKQAKPVAA